MGDEKWSLDAAFGYALKSNEFRRDEIVCTKTLYNYVDLGLLPIKNIDLPEKLRRNTHNGAVILLHPTSATNAAILGDMIRE